MESCTATPPAKQAAKIMLALSGEAFRCVEHLSLDATSAEFIGAETGLPRLLKTLEDTFKETDEAEVLTAIEKMMFGTRRERGESMKQWISKANRFFFGEQCIQKESEKFRACSAQSSLSWCGLLQLMKRCVARVCNVWNVCNV